MLRWHAAHRGQEAQPDDAAAVAAAVGVGGGAGEAGGLAVPAGVAARAGRALPYAVALAAVLSVESPFVHIEVVSR